MDAKAKQKALDAIAEKLSHMPLYPGANFVPGDGNPDADIIFIGEAPGAEEDKQGIPFVGAAGKFLNEMLESIGMQRSDIFITNVVKQRPPNNRDPLPNEIAAHWPLLQEQLDVIQPKVVITLGRHAMGQLLPDVGTISQIHGKAFRRTDGRVYFPLYHPAAALYNGGLRSTLIEDFQKIPALLKKIDAGTSTTEQAL